MKSKLVTLSIVALMAMTLAVGSASAAVLSIEFTGLNLMYDGNNLFDAGGAFDPLTTMVFNVDGNPAGPVYTGAQNIGIDMFIANLGPILSGSPGDYFSSFPGFGLDLYANGGKILELDWDSAVKVSYNNGALAVLGSAMTSSVNAQNLPFGLAFQTPVTVSFSTQITNSTIVPPPTGAQGDVFRNFASAGTGEVRGPAVPEPLTLLTIGFGLLGGGIVSRRRKNN